MRQTLTGCDLLVYGRDIASVVVTTCTRLCPRKHRSCSDTREIIHVGDQAEKCIQFLYMIHQHIRFREILPKKSLFVEFLQSLPLIFRICIKDDLMEITQSLQTKRHQSQNKNNEWRKQYKSGIINAVDTFSKHANCQEVRLGA